MGLVLLSASCATHEHGLPPSVIVSPEEFRATSNAPSAVPVTASLGLVVEDHETDTLENLEILPGARVREIVPGAPAAASGLLVGDVILAANGVPTNGRDGFQAVVRSTGDGEHLELEVRRGTVVFTTLLSIQFPGEETQLKEIYRADPLRTRAGYRSVVVQLNGESRVAAELVKFFPGSPLASLELTPGTRILALEGIAVTSAAELVRRLIEEHDFGDRVRMTFVRNPDLQPAETVRVRLWSPRRRVARFSVPFLVHYESSLDPATVEFRLLDLWLLSLFSYERNEGEKQYRILRFLRFGSGHGELVEETVNGASR